MATDDKKEFTGKITKIRSNSGVRDSNVYIGIHANDDHTYWCSIVPDNEGAKWIIQLALTAKTNDLKIYLSGLEYEHKGDSTGKRYKILEFGLE